jgi:hypothetical protein
MSQLHHLDWGTEPAFDVGCQLISEDRQFCAIGRPNVRRKISLSTFFTAQRSKEDEVGKLACGQPRHSASVVNSPKCQASITIEAIPAQVGGFEPFTGHGLHGVPEECLYDLYRHA